MYIVYTFHNNTGEGWTILSPFWVYIVWITISILHSVQFLYIKVFDSEPDYSTTTAKFPFYILNTFYIDLNVSTRLRNIHKCFWKNILSNYYLWIDKMFWLPKSYFAIVNNSLSETWKSIGWWKFGTLLDWTRSYKASTTHCPVQTQSNQHN